MTASDTGAAGSSDALRTCAPCCAVGLTAIGATDGTVVEASGAGRSAMSATSNATPTAMPARRPPMIAVRGPIAGSAGYQYHPAAGSRRIVA